MGVRLVRGRTLSEDDADEPRAVAVVNRTFVDAYFARTEPLGRQIRVSLRPAPGAAAVPTSFEIVGVVDDIRNRGLRDQPGPEVHLPGIAAGHTPVVLVRTAAQPATAANAIRHELNGLDRRVALRTNR